MPILWGLIVVILAEIALFVWIGGLIGVGAVLALVLLSALVGVMAVRGQLPRIAALAQAGGDPAVLLAGGMMTVLGAALLILPGCATDVLGLALVMPPVQRAAGALLARRLNIRRSTIIEGEYHIHEPRPQDTGPAPRTLPPRGH